MIYLKLAGSLITIFACLQFGVYKSYNSKKKRDVLQKINLALETLSIEIRLKRGELNSLFIRLFCDEHIGFSDNRFVISQRYIEKEQLEKLNELAMTLGKSDAEGECEIIAIYRSVFSDFLSEAEKKYASDRKLWNTLSLGAGLTIVLLLV